MFGAILLIKFLDYNSVTVLSYNYQSYTLLVMTYKPFKHFTLINAYSNLIIFFVFVFFFKMYRHATMKITVHSNLRHHLLNVYIGWQWNLMF